MMGDQRFCGVLLVLLAATACGGHTIDFHSGSGGDDGSSGNAASGGDLVGGAGGGLNGLGGHLVGGHSGGSHSFGGSEVATGGGVFQASGGADFASGGGVFQASGGADFASGGGVFQASGGAGFASGGGVFQASGGAGFTGSLNGGASYATGGGSPLDERRGFLVYDVNSTGVSRDIVFTAVGGEVCTKTVIGTTAQEKQPAISPDGKQLAYASDATGVFQIYVINPTTGKTQQLTNSELGGTYPAWSPSGTQLAFVSGDAEVHTESNYGDVEILDLETGEIKNLIPRAAAQTPWTAPVFADDDLLLVGNGTSLIGYHISTDKSYDVVPQTSRQPHPHDASPAPDNLRLIFSDSCPSGDGPDNSTQQLYIGRIDGSTGDTCQSAFRVANGEGRQAADWSFNDWIAAETANGLLVVMPADGSTYSLFLPTGSGPARNPSWAPASYMDALPKFLADCAHGQ